MDYSRIFLLLAGGVVLVGLCGVLAAGDDDAAPTSQPATREAAIEAAGVVFRHDVESGSVVEEWQADDAGNIYGDERLDETGPSPGSRVDAVTQPVHTGKYAARWTVGDPSMVPGKNYTGQVKGMRWRLGLTEGYYSCWYWFPAEYTMNPAGDNWNNIMQWKNADGRHCYPIAAIGTKAYDFDKDGTFKDYLVISNLLGEKWGAMLCELPKERWFQVQVYFKVGQADGAVRIWVDGKLRKEFKDIRTQKSPEQHGTRDVMYGVGSYPGRTEKKGLVFYTDDCFATRRYLDPAVFKLPAAQPAESKD